jgi:glycosyltransferase involved in cell wall biosynthesis
VQEVITKVKKASPPEKEIIIVDDHSTDGTWEVLQKYAICPDIKLLRHSQNRGKAAAVNTVLPLVRGRVMIIQDADLEYDPQDYQKLLPLILEGKADAVYGSRLRGKPAGMRLSFYLGNKLLTLLTNLLFNLRLTDMETCYKMLRGEIARKLTITARRFGIEPEITAKLALAGYRIREKPIRYHPRTHAEGKKIKWFDGIKAVLTLLRWRLVRKVKL